MPKPYLWNLANCIIFVMLCVVAVSSCEEIDGSCKARSVRVAQDVDTDEAALLQQTKSHLSQASSRLFDIASRQHSHVIFDRSKATAVKNTSAFTYGIPTSLAAILLQAGATARIANQAQLDKPQPAQLDKPQPAQLDKLQLAQLDKPLQRHGDHHEFLLLAEKAAAVKASNAELSGRLDTGHVRKVGHRSTWSSSSVVAGLVFLVLIAVACFILWRWRAHNGKRNMLLASEQNRVQPHCKPPEQSLKAGDGILGTIQNRKPLLSDTRYAIPLHDLLGVAFENSLWFHILCEYGEPVFHVQTRGTAEDRVLEIAKICDRDHSEVVATVGPGPSSTSFATGELGPDGEALHKHQLEVKVQDKRQAETASPLRHRATLETQGADHSCSVIQNAKRAFIIEGHQERCQLLVSSGSNPAVAWIERKGMTYLGTEFLELVVHPGSDALLLLACALGVIVLRSWPGQTAHPEHKQEQETFTYPEKQPARKLVSS